MELGQYSFILGFGTRTLSKLMLMGPYCIKSRIEIRGSLLGCSTINRAHVSILNNTRPRTALPRRLQMSRLEC
jgi:hypothetical protein